MKRLVDVLANQPQCSIKIIKIEDSKKVVYTNPIYKDSPCTSPFTFGEAFTDSEVLYSVEMEEWLSKTFGYKKGTSWEFQH